MKKRIRVIITFVAIFAIVAALSYIYYINRCKVMTVEQVLNVKLSSIEKLYLTNGCQEQKGINDKDDIQEILHSFFPVKIKGTANLDKYFSTRTGGEYFSITTFNKNDPSKYLRIFSDGLIIVFEEDKPRNYYRTIEPVDQRVINQLTEKYLS